MQFAFYLREPWLGLGFGLD